MACMRDGFEPGRSLDNGRFMTVSPLNHGSFGMVLAANDTFTGEDVAIKCITKPIATATHSTCPAALATDERSEELTIHSKLLKHPNIVNLLHYFETGNHQYMVLELCNNGDLYEAIRLGKGPLETGHVRDFMLELVSAVDHMHSHGVYHRDIKPENIFLTSTGSLKLGDFGLATTDTWSTEFAVGSDRYMAPEQYDASVYGYGYSPAAADIWAIGIVLLNIIFQRNPFATPTQQDPLFADFAHDRQSLFDVFPNMSQDTYNVLVHSLALDPANRSLAAVREALTAVVSFTIDDESLDDFCTEHSDVMPVATAAREPLRTPSLTSPAMSTEGSFPWPTALLKTPQKTSRQLSTIRDDESELFPASVNSKWYGDIDAASLSSALDSGLGMSYKSTKSFQSAASASTSIKSKPGFVGSLPISFTRPSVKASAYGANGFSKSWSDLYDEEEEQTRDAFSREDAGNDIERVDTAKPGTPQLQHIKDDGRGSVTPRQGLVDMDANARSATPMKSAPADDKPELTKTKSSFILDKWAALGTLRRARQEPAASPMAVATPPKTKYADAFANFSPWGNKKAKTQSKQHDGSSNWRQNSGSPQRLRSNSMNNSKVWQEDKNWREHKPPSIKAPSPRPGRQLHKLESNFLDELDDEEDSPVWVGGYELPL
ncbi:Serine threonine- kinase ksp1 [Lecanosticta acicola]|uniref:Serine threonine- kinase ksp1 n=1 Tax=Lecanosticta acicola TaxID=111012 RepID=A0AAI8Z287_9PEZI|nr:Serine threonine- kinase ksp1 [Lecanosticta acicola]